MSDIFVEEIVFTHFKQMSAIKNFFNIDFFPNFLKSRV